MRTAIVQIAFVSWAFFLCCSGSESTTTEPAFTPPEKNQASQPESSEPPKAQNESPKKSKAILMVIAPKNFRDEELFITREILEGAGYKITLASTSTDEAVGMLGGKALPELLVSQVKAEDFEAVVFIGGAGTKVILKDEATLALAKAAVGAGKLVAAICMAPEILANAGLLKGKKATCWAGGRDNIKAQGAEVVDTPVVTDGLIVTGNGPTAARAFGETILGILTKDQ
jgi:protease I